MTISFVTEAEDGEVTEPRQPASYTWAELRTHALYPAEATTVEDATVEVAAGSFQTRRYTVRSEVDGATSVTVFDFAVKLPGPPVRFVTTTDGVVTTRWELLSRSPRPPSK